MTSSLVIGHTTYGHGLTLKNYHPFSEIYDSFIDVEKNIDLSYTTSNKTKNIDALLLWGGIDIHPSIYGQKPHPDNQQRHAIEPGFRDLMEWDLIRKAYKKGIPIIGVCRGAQMLCCFAGGSLYQHVTGHVNGSHEMTTYKGDIIRTNSAHHQMMDVTNTEHELLAWSTVNRSDGYWKETKVEGPEKEPEVVYFPKMKALAIQGHPEWIMDKKDSFVEFVLDEIMEKLV